MFRLLLNALYPLNAIQNRLKKYPRQATPGFHPQYLGTQSTKCQIRMYILILKSSS